MTLKIHVLCNVLAEIRSGKVRLWIEEPVSLETKDVFRKKIKVHEFRRRVAQLKSFLNHGEDGNVILADEECPVRLGGGFVQIEREKIILVKRDENAPRLRLTFDIPAGMFDEQWESPFEMMVAESAEILRLGSDYSLYYVSFNAYDEALLGELERIVNALRKEMINVESLISLPSRTIKIDSDVEFIDYLGERIENINLAFEYEDSSIEIIGFVDVLGSLEYAFGDGELGPNDSLLSREVHVVDMATTTDCVWRLFRFEREDLFSEELARSKGVTSKVAAALRTLNLERRISVPRSDLWETL